MYFQGTDQCGQERSPCFLPPPSLLSWPLPRRVQVWNMTAGGSCPAWNGDHQGPQLLPCPWPSWTLDSEARAQSRFNICSTVELWWAALKANQPGCQTTGSFFSVFLTDFSMKFEATRPIIFINFIYHAALNIERASELKRNSSRTRLEICQKIYTTGFSGQEF